MIKELFCNKDCKLETAIPKFILDNILGNTLKGEIEARYNDMRDNFDKTYDEWQDHFTTLGKPFRNQSDTTSICMSPANTSLTNISQYSQIGFDLPTWMNIKPDRPVVMFITQDPLRADSYIKCHDIVVSSPFSVHEKQFRESNQGNLYYRIFNQLVSADLGIYLTPGNKFSTKGEGSKQLAKEYSPSYKNIIHQEIELVKPDLIVIFGTFPTDFILNEYNFFKKSEFLGIPALPMVQPGGITKKSLKKYLKIDDFTSENIADEYAKLIQRALLPKK